METSALRYVIIGAGAGIASTHMAALAKLPAQSAAIVGLCDVDAQRGQPRADALGAPFFSDHRAMLAKIEADVAAICTPHPLHPLIALDCFSAGLHVLTEKPIAVEVADADAMIAAADSAHRLLAVSFQHRSRPVVQRTRQMIRSGELGALVRVLCVEPWLRSAGYYQSASWRGRWDSEGGGVLMNQAPHTLDLLCYLVGQPAKVWGWIRRRYHAMECEDTAQAMLEFPNGAPGYFTTSTAEVGGQRRIQIIGEKAAVEIIGDTLTIQTFDPALRDYIATSSDPFGSPAIQGQTLDLPPDDSQGNHVGIYLDLQAAIRESKPPLCDGREGRMSLELANAITYSSFSGQPAALPLDRAAYSALLHDLRSGTRSL